MKIDFLWAPWRLEYVKGKRPEGCPFCEAPQEEPSPENLVLYKDNQVFVVMNKFPYNPGHLLVVPRAHVGDPLQLDPKVWLRCQMAVRGCIQILTQTLNPKGFNLGTNLGSAAGAGIPAHLHHHILPRWDGDTNFMPLIADTKALPTHNEKVYAELKSQFVGFASQLG